MKNDSELQRDVLDELKWEPAVTAAHIGVTAKQGIVTLTGHVPSYVEKTHAEMAATRVYGVKAVANELDVKLPGSLKRTDEDIAASCANGLAENYSVPNDKVKCLVRDGWVTLSGQVDWYFQKMAAEDSVRYLAGVRGISNNVTLKPRVSGEAIKKQIEAAFKRSAEIDSSRVFVETEGSSVTLSGRVHSFAERMEATHAAWAAPGVTSVRNDITIQP